MILHQHQAATLWLFDDLGVSTSYQVWPKASISF